MPPSQLKRLKSSLREQGITGPQKSKKVKKSQKNDQKRHADRHTALQNIRDSFNPFELRPGSARPAKFESVSHASANKAAAGGKYKQVLHRPGVSKSAGEEMRRRQLLPEMQRRNKVGGLVDRRIGEGDPGMTAEERAVQRFAREKQGKKNGGMFDLEGGDDDEGAFGLTHGGRSLAEFGDDDFADGGSLGEGSGSEDDEFLKRKRRRSDEEDEVGDVDGMEGTDGAEDAPERKKTKKEVMQEVIAKSKLHKYERQKVKEDDDDLREELDKGMSDMLALLQGHKPASKALEREVEKEAEAAVANGAGMQMNPDRQRLLDGMDRQKADKEYEVRLRQLAQDTRAKPSERSKTEEEKVAQEASRVEDLEEKRAKRMRGEDVSDEEDSGQGAHEEDVAVTGPDAFGNDETMDEAAEFGLPSALPQQQAEPEEKVEHEDEDEFAMDDDLIASDSEVDISSESGASSASDDEEADPEVVRDEEEDDEFVKGILGTSTDSPALTGANAAPKGATAGLSYTYPCPRTYAELLDVVKNTPVEQLPSVVQRIRALHHPSLSASNKESMADFSSALVDHIAYLANTKTAPLAVVEQLIRHLHSLSRTYPSQIGEAFRRHLKAFHERGQPEAGDLVVLTAIGSIYPTSDHFHQVVTPAITVMARWLGLNAADTVEKRATGAYLVALCLGYQKLSKRYVPEAVRFIFRALSTSKPVLSTKELRPHLDNLIAMADLWKEKSAFSEIFAPFLPLLQKMGAKREHQHLQILLQQSHMRRRPLELHHHRPQPIRTSIPKFEEGFNPDKHYDPDKERSDARKLQKEFKREKKGAIRELRKDASFMAREQLRNKRERDAEYEKKQRRLIAEIQGEEGHENKVYAREKAARKRAAGR